MINEMPNSVESEQAVIGGLVASRGNEEQFHDVIGRLSGEMFYSEVNGKLFDLIQGIANSGKPVELAAIVDQIDATGRAYLAEIIKANPGYANLPYYADIVYQKHYERTLIQRFTMAANSLAGAGSHQEKIDYAMSMISQVDEPVEDNAEYIGDLLGAYIEELDARFNSGGEIIGLKTGLIDLDEQIQGLRSGDLVIVAGRPSMGKTVLAMNIAEACAIEGGHVKVFSMEMPKQQLVERSVASRGRIPLGQLRNGKVEQQSWAGINKGIAEIQPLRLNIDDRGALTINQVKAAARKSHRKQKLDLIVIDYIQLMAGTKGHQSRVSEITEITMGLKALAKELDVPIIAISQLSRKVEDRPNKRPMMSDLRDSGSIEQDADIIIMMYRDEYYKPDSEYKGMAEAIVTKHRAGELGTVHLASNLHYARFDNFTGRMPEPYQDKPNTKKWGAA